MRQRHGRASTSKPSPQALFNQTLSCQRYTENTAKVSDDTWCCHLEIDLHAFVSHSDTNVETVHGLVVYSKLCL